MARKKLTPNQQVYQRERRRLQQSKYYAQRKGYVFETDPVPQMPKRVTRQAIERIQKMTTSDLYPLAKQGVDQETGEIIEGGVNARKHEKRISKQRRSKAQRNRYKKRTREVPFAPPPEQDKRTSFTENPVQNFSRQLIDNAKSEILHMPPDISDRLVGLINQLVHYNGEDAVAKSLMAMPGKFHYYLQLYKYDSEAAAEGYASDLINYLPDVSEQFKADLLDAFEYHETGYVIEWENANIVTL